MGSGIYPRLNFNSFQYSFLTVFALLVGEDWNFTLYRYVKGSNGNEL